MQQIRGPQNLPQSLPLRWRRRRRRAKLPQIPSLPHHSPINKPQRHILQEIFPQLLNQRKRIQTLHSLGK